MKRYSNKNELQQQLLSIYDNFKNGNLSNRKIKQANNILKILKSIDNIEIAKELEKYIYDNRLKSKLFVSASKPSMKCHLKYCFNYPSNYKTRLKKANKDIKKAIESDIKQDDFKNVILENDEKSKLKNLSQVMASMEKLSNMQKIAKM